MSGGSLRRPMGYFGLFNRWWSNFFLKNGRRPTKTDIEIWRAENQSWRPELSVEDIVQHSKGRRDPEKNRQYFVEYRRKLKGIEKRTAKRQGRGRRVSARKPEADDPWEVSTSEEMEEDGEEDTDDDMAPMRPPRRQVHPKCCGAILHRQASSSLTSMLISLTEATEPKAAATIQTQVKVSVASAANGEAVVSGGGSTSCAMGPYDGTVANASSSGMLVGPAKEPASPVAVNILIRRTRGPRAANLLRCESLRPRLPQGDLVALPSAHVGTGGGSEGWIAGAATADTTDLLFGAAADGLMPAAISTSRPRYSASPVPLHPGSWQRSGLPLDWGLEQSPPSQQAYPSCGGLGLSWVGSELPWHAGTTLARGAPLPAASPYPGGTVHAYPCVGSATTDCESVSGVCARPPFDDVNIHRSHSMSSVSTCVAIGVSGTRVSSTAADVTEAGSLARKRATDNDAETPTDRSAGSVADGVTSPTIFKAARPPRAQSSYDNMSMDIIRQQELLSHMSRHPIQHSAPISSPPLAEALGHETHIPCGAGCAWQLPPRCKDFQVISDMPCAHMVHQSTSPSTTEYGSTSASPCTAFLTMETCRSKPPHPHSHSAYGGSSESSIFGTYATLSFDYGSGLNQGIISMPPQPQLPSSATIASVGNGEATEEADFMDAEWLDNLFSESEMAVLLNGPLLHMPKDSAVSPQCGSGAVLGLPAYVDSGPGVDTWMS